MSRRAVDFDDVARIYRLLELVAFGRDLERARFAFLDRCSNAGQILMLGEGDGRALARLLKIAPNAHIHYVDLSAAMLARAEKRIPEADRARVSFEQVDIFSAEFPRESYDVVTTFFFLDCFTTVQVEAIVGRVRASVRTSTRWLFADFAIPAKGYARWRARLWLRLLYSFFRWKTGLAIRSLPPSEDILKAAGFVCAESRELQRGLLRSAVFIQPGSRT